jgi:hypothetical protein
MARWVALVVVVALAAAVSVALSVAVTVGGGGGDFLIRSVITTTLIITATTGDLEPLLIHGPITNKNPQTSAIPP